MDSRGHGEGKIVDPNLVKAVRWAVIASAVVAAATVGVVYLLMYLNYAPLWLRVYSACVDSQPEVVSITEALRHRSQCMRWAVEEQMRLDQNLQ